MSHELTRVVTYKELHHLEYLESQDGEEMLGMEDFQFLRSINQSRIKCSCGQKFNKEKTAIEHLRQEGEIET